MVRVSDFKLLINSYLNSTIDFSYNGFFIKKMIFLKNSEEFKDIKNNYKYRLLLFKMEE